MQAHRQRYKGRGIFDCNLNWGAVNSGSFVLATICEVTPHGVLAGGVDASRFLGAANMQVLNVRPHSQGVTVRVNIDWGSQLDFAIDFVVV